MAFYARTNSTGKLESAVVADDGAPDAAAAVMPGVAIVAAAVAAALF